MKREGSHDGCQYKSKGKTQREKWACRVALVWENCYFSFPEKQKILKLSFCWWFASNNPV